MNQSPAFGKPIHEGDIDLALLTGPGEDLVPKLLIQLSSVPGFKKLFGTFKPQAHGKTMQPQAQRWADYNREDWSARMLPAVNVYEADNEDKTSDQAWLNGTVNIQVFWPPSQRRSDWSRVAVAFKGALENFFRSKFCQDMLDEIYFVQRPMKVNGLNELGKVLNWSPNIEGIVENDWVPVTLVSVRYRIDLRAWDRAMEFQGRTKANPFALTLDPLTVIGGEGSSYQGLDDKDVVHVEVQDEITVSNP